MNPLRLVAVAAGSTLLWTASPAFADDIEECADKLIGLCIKKCMKDGRSKDACKDDCESLESIEEALKLCEASARNPKR